MNPIPQVMSSEVSVLFPRHNPTTSVVLFLRLNWFFSEPRCSGNSLSMGYIYDGVQINLYRILIFALHDH